MAGRKAIEKFVRKIYDMRKRGDLDGLAQIVTPKFSHQIAGEKKFCSIAGKITGRAAFRRRMDSLIEFSFANQKMLAIVVDGNTAAVRWRAKVMYRPIGKAATTEFCDFLTIKNGKVETFEQFFDTALVADLMKN